MQFLDRIGLGTDISLAEGIVGITAYAHDRLRFSFDREQGTAMGLAERTDAALHRRAGIYGLFRLAHRPLLQHAFMRSIPQERPPPEDSGRIEERGTEAERCRREEKTAEL